VSVRFCWLCGNKLWGNNKGEKLTVDRHERVLHKQCAKEVKKGYDFRRDKDGAYHSMLWATEAYDKAMAVWLEGRDTD
jgi:hypothetical protein